MTNIMTFNKLYGFLVIFSVFIFLPMFLKNKQSKIDAIIKKNVKITIFSEIFNKIVLAIVAFFYFLLKKSPKKLIVFVI